MYPAAARTRCPVGSSTGYHLQARGHPPEVVRRPSESPRDAEAQPLALALHSFMNCLAGVLVRRVAREVRVVVERLAGEPRGTPEWERSARPHLPSPATERGVSRLTRLEV